MAKIYIRRILSIVSIILITHFLLITTQVRYDYNNIDIEGYYKEEKGSLDFVLLGSSEAYSDYCPALAYKDFGFTSYVYAIDNSPFITYEDQLDEIYRYQNPKLVMIEFATVIPDKEDMEVGADFFDGTFRKLSDSIPNLQTRYQLAEEFGKDPIESYLYTPIKYHGKKPKFDSILTNITFHLRNYSLLKGYVSHTVSKPVEAKLLNNVKGDRTEKPLPEEYEKALISLLEHCKEKNYNVVFTRFPHRLRGKYRLYRYWQGNYAARLIEEYGFEFVDFEQCVDEMGISKLDDFYNESHLRASGAQKMTKYVGQMLTEQYGIKPAELSENTAARWDESVKYCDAFFKYYEELEGGTTEEDDVFMTESAWLLYELKKRM